MVMEKFRLFVEIRGVVLIALDDEFLAAAESVTPVAEIRHHAADEKVRTPPRDMEYPGKHRRRRRLPVRPGDDDRIVAGQKVILDDLRHRTVGNFLVQYGL